MADAGCRTGGLTGFVINRRPARHQPVDAFGITTVEKYRLAFFHMRGMDGRSRRGRPGGILHRRSAEAVPEE